MKDLYERYFKNQKMNNYYMLLPRDLITGNYKSEAYLSQHNSRSMIPNFFYEFSNKNNLLILSVRDIVDTDILCHSLNNVITTDTELCFDLLYEGNTLMLASLVHEMLHKLKIAPHKVHCFTDGLNVEEIYGNWCKDNNIIDRINFYGCAAWEYDLRKRCERFKIDQTKEYAIKVKEKNFICWNRVLRLHRFVLIGMLARDNLISNSYVSFFPNGHHDYNEKIPDKVSLIDDYFLEMVKQKLNDDNLFTELNKEIDKLNLPLTTNIEVGNNKNYLNQDDFVYFDNSYFSLVTETYFYTVQNDKIFDQSEIFFSEKIFKPIAMKHPFILVSRPHSLQWLKKIGYKTFSPYINEEYDSIENDAERMTAIIKEVNRLCSQSPNQWLEWQKCIKDVVEYNARVFFSKNRYTHAYSRYLSYD